MAPEKGLTADQSGMKHMRKSFGEYAKAQVDRVINCIRKDPRAAGPCEKTLIELGLLEPSPNSCFGTGFQPSQLQQPSPVKRDAPASDFGAADSQVGTCDGSASAGASVDDARNSDSGGVGDSKMG